MKIVFLGVGSCMPVYETDDTASLLIDNHIMIDTGWNPIRNLLKAGVNPNEITHLFFTHMHQDHYLGLAQLLFYIMNSRHSFEGLHIYGPEGMGEILDRALLFAGFDHHHAGTNREAIRLNKPESDQLPERGAMRINGIQLRFIPSRHAVPGRCYRVADANGNSMTYTGDTAVFGELVDFARGSDVLIHEAAFGANSSQNGNAYYHSSAVDAAVTAKQASVKILYLVHTPVDARKTALDSAETIFPARYPIENETVLI